MDARAKQRLTGAVILVALFVLLVPELLTGPGDAQPPAQAEEEAGLRRYTIELDRPEATSGAAPAAQPVVELPPVTSPAPARPTAQAPAARPGDEAATERASPPPPAPTPAVPPARVAEPAARPSTPPATARGSFAVQLGSFRDHDNAQRLVRDMKAQGFSAFIAPITSGGRELFRVRVGPSRDRAAAEALAADLRKIGQTGSIVPIP